MNLVAPGIGQLMAGMWFRGALELLTAIICLLWCLFEVIAPIALSVRNMLSGDGDIVKVNLWNVGASICLLILLYVWSIIELYIVLKDEEPQTQPPA